MENLNLKNGDVITLSSGEKVTVSLTPVVLEPKFNTWYICRRTNQLIYRSDNNNFFYGIINGQWVGSGLGCSGTYPAWDLASKEEIEQALTAEAIKRGYDKANQIKSFFGGISNPANAETCYSSWGEFWYRGWCVMNEKGEWAEIQKSVLEGKVAVKVSNQREMVIIEKYILDTLGGVSEHTPDYQYYTNIARYIHKHKGFDGVRTCERNGFTVISFEDFAKEIGIEVPKFIIRSEDGVDLYEGDEFYSVYRDCDYGYGSSKDWTLDGKGGIGIPHTDIKYRVAYYTKNKFFSSKQKVEQWIVEANSPKEYYYAILATRNHDGTITSSYSTELFLKKSIVVDAVDKFTKRYNSELVEYRTIKIK